MKLRKLPAKKRLGTHFPLTGLCPIREHTGDGSFVGRCEFATYANVCPRHGRLDMYPDRDDREVLVMDRDYGDPDLARLLGH